MLTMTGQLQGIRTSSYQGQAKAYLQFLDKKPDGSLGFTEVKIPDGMDHRKFRVGDKINVPVEYKLVRDKIYWSVTNEISLSGPEPAKAA